MYFPNRNTVISMIITIIIISACSGKEAYLITRNLLGYIPPPEVPSIMAQLKEELIRCERAGGELCEKQAMTYVRTVNTSLQREPLKGVVVITRVDDGIEVEYEADDVTKDNDSDIKK